MVHPFDDVAALSQRAQNCLSLVSHHPLPGYDLSSKAKRFELAQAAGLLRQIGIGLLPRERRHIDDALSVGIAEELAIEPRPAIGIDLTIETALDIEIGAQPKFLRDQVLCPRPHPLADIGTRNDEVFAVIGGGR